MNKMNTAPGDREITLHFKNRVTRKASLQCLEGGDEITGEGFIFSWALGEFEKDLPDWEDGWMWEHSRKPIGWSD